MRFIYSLVLCLVTTFRCIAMNYCAIVGEEVIHSKRYIDLHMDCIVRDVQNVKGGSYTDASVNKLKSHVNVLHPMVKKMIARQIDDLGLLDEECDEISALLFEINEALSKTR